MAKRDRKDGKVDVSEAGRGTALKHNPFGTLGGISTPPSMPAGATPGTEPARTEAKKPRGRLVLRREKKQRGGKTVVVVAGLRAHAHLAESEIAALAQHVKQQLGCGGTVERVAADSELVLQGDQPARVAELLRTLGFRVEGVTKS